MLVDSDHAGDNRSRRSRTGFVILVNGALLISFQRSSQPLRPRCSVLNSAH
ncbi:hypothetical protein ACHAXN_001471 [Cyclotella atomus]